MLYIGSHVNYKKDNQLVGCVLDTINYGANSFMFYTGAPQNTLRSSIDDGLTLEALNLMKKNDIKLENVIVHAPYIINLCNDNDKDKDKYFFTVNFLEEEVRRCERFGVKYLVLHPGSHVGMGIDNGINNIVRGLNRIFTDGCNVTILLETMAGKGTEVGSKLEEIKRIIDEVEDKEHIGVCLDTCHLSDAGYDITDFDKFLDMFDEIIGIDYIKCIHVNDSKNPVGAHKDRHENFGFGHIGFDTLINIVYNKRVENVPKILETPYVDGMAPYKFEIEMIKNKFFDENLIEKIKKQD